MKVPIEIDLARIILVFFFNKIFFVKMILVFLLFFLFAAFGFCV